MKIYNFSPIFDNFNENFAIFSKFFKKFLEFFEKKFGPKFISMNLYGLGGGAPKLAKLLKT